MKMGDDTARCEAVILAALPAQPFARLRTTSPGYIRSGTSMKEAENEGVPV